MRRIGDEQLYRMIRKAQGEHSLREFSREIGVSAAYLSDILRGNRGPGKKILDYFGLERKREVKTWYAEKNSKGK